MTTYHILLDVLALDNTAPLTACHEDGCNIYAPVTCVRCYEQFCSNHNTGTKKIVSYGNASIPLCLKCITPQEIEANKTNTSTE